MSRQLFWMREGAAKNISAYRDENGLYHGIGFVNHPTPSGCSRMLPTVSDPKGYTTEQEALDAFRILIGKLDVEQKRYYEELDACSEEKNAPV